MASLLFRHGKNAKSPDCLDTLCHDCGAVNILTLRCAGARNKRAKRSPRRGELRGRGVSCCDDRAEKPLPPGIDLLELLEQCVSLRAR
jgi:hypothetical protein